MVPFVIPIVPVSEILYSFSSCLLRVSQILSGPFRGICSCFSNSPDLFERLFSCFSNPPNPFRVVLLLVSQLLQRAVALPPCPLPLPSPASPALLLCPPPLASCFSNPLVPFERFVSGFLTLVCFLAVCFVFLKTSVRAVCFLFLKSSSFFERFASCFSNPPVRFEPFCFLFLKSSSPLSNGLVPVSQIVQYLASVLLPGRFASCFSNPLVLFERFASYVSNPLVRLEPFDS